MAIVELYDEHKLHDIVAVNGEPHVIITIFDDNAYQTQPLKNWIENHTLLYFGEGTDGITISSFVEILMQEALEDGCVKDES